MISIESLSEKLLKEKSVALFMHTRPDGDTIGSTVALKLALKSKGINAEVFCCDKIPEKFCFLKSVKSVSDKFFGEYSAFVAVDCADLSRLGDFSELFKSHKNTYNVDHHVSNTLFAKINYVADNASNCENVFELIKRMGIDVTEEVANLLATGVITDTGNFSHKNVRAETLQNAGELVSLGADVNLIIYHTFKSQSKARALLFGKVMSKIRYFLDDRFAVSSIFNKDLVDCGATPDETEGFIDFVMGIECVEVGASIMEISHNKYKISFRSKNADVNAVAGLFGGGGHTLASGCQIAGEYEEVVDKITFAVSRYLQD
ncbi:MAG: bifunctional oligoribonuclease/PAP phosphatase NrnA [Clostridia bacterium]|nr:bifunctional oligoribonuclease/PAP phosphatase NrnA [Clostridia bacterium]